MECSTEKKHRERAPLDMSDWAVINDWPKPVPMTIEEIYVFEAYFGDILDELFPESASPRKEPTRRHSRSTCSLQCQPGFTFPSPA